ncbi:MAG: glycerophosphodiester phosphodiesterase [Candidatus Kariarchaeaceae archaeon]
MTHICAHRGWKDENTLENTLSAFSNAFSGGCDAVELDVHQCADGKWLIHHNRTYLNQRNVIANMTSRRINHIANELNREVTYLDEVIEQFRGKHINIECKPKSQQTGYELTKYLEEKDFLTYCNISSFSIPVLVGSRKASPDIRLSLLGLILREKNWKAVNKALGLYSINPSYYLLSKKLIMKAHSNNVEVHVWTVNKSYLLRRLMRQGVNSIITDQPKLALNLRDMISREKV